MSEWRKDAEATAAIATLSIEGWRKYSRQESEGNKWGKQEIQR